MEECVNVGESYHSHILHHVVARDSHSVFERFVTRSGNKASTEFVLLTKKSEDLGGYRTNDFREEGAFLI